MLRHVDSTAVYILILLILALWISYALADEAQDVMKSLGADNAFVEDGVCTIGKQETMCHKVLLPEYPDFVYYVVYNKRAVGGKQVWVPIVIKKCSLDLSLQTNIWQNIDGEKPDVPVKKPREWNA